MTIRVEPPLIFADHVRFVCSGEYSLDEALATFEQALGSAAAAGRDAALLDVRELTGPTPTLADRYRLAVRIAEIQVTQVTRVRFALLGREPLIHPERFGDVVAATHGATARAFTDEAMALGWLLGSNRGR